MALPSIIAHAVNGEVEEIRRMLQEASVEVRSRLLLERDSFGNTPLHWARNRGTAAELLAPASSDNERLELLQQRNDDSRTPADYAKRNGDAELLPFLEAVEDRGGKMEEIAMKEAEEKAVGKTAKKEVEEKAPHAAIPGRVDKHRWCAGLEDPAEAGTRDILPIGWTPGGCKFPEAVKVFGHTDKELDALEEKGSKLQRELALLDVHTTAQHAAAIYAFTDEGPQANDLYKKLGAACRDSGYLAEKRLDAYRPYLYFLQKARSLAPNFVGTAFRGIEKRVSAKSYRVGAVITWQAFTSTSRSQKQAKGFVNVDERGSKLSGSMFIIHVTSGKEITPFSAFPDEAEVLLDLNTFMEVKEILPDEAAKQAALPDLGHYGMQDLDVYVFEEV